MFAVILAGGSGTRFWPLSREKRPKQFLSLGGKLPLLRATAERILPLCGWEKMLVVATAMQRQGIRRMLPELPAENLLIEPRPRNTAPAVGLASAFVAEKDEAAVLAVLPSDHVIGPLGRFRALIRVARAEAAGGSLITLGITPTRPETGFGYIEAGANLRCRKGFEVREALAFHEKPDLPTALDYVKSGRYFWNSGMFVFRADRMLHEIDRHMPRLGQGLRLFRTAARRMRAGVLERLFARVESISIDYAVMEKASQLRVIPAPLQWSDAGSWAALLEVEARDGDGSVVKGDVLRINCRDCVLQSHGRLLACLGLKDLIVVETPDAVLVCPRDEAQAVRQLVEALRKKGRKEVL